MQFQNVAVVVMTNRRIVKRAFDGKNEHTTISVNSAQLVVSVGESIKDVGIQQSS